MRNGSLLALSMALTATLSVSVSLAGDHALGKGNLHQIGGSGIRGEVLALDSGNADTGLIVSGRAEGLDPEQTYVSLIYDVDSVPGGPDACVPTGTTLAGNQRFVGVWQVAGDGSGTLFATKTGDSYAALTDVGAVSIRLGDGSLQACGRVTPK